MREIKVHLDAGTFLDVPDHLGLGRFAELLSKSMLITNPKIGIEVIKSILIPLRMVHHSQLS